MVRAVRGGVPLRHAGAYAGVTDRTLHRALTRGREVQARVDEGEVAEADLVGDDVAYLRLFVQVEKARADAVVTNVANVAKVARGGTLVREVTRTYRNDDGEMVTETDRTYAPPDWRASKWMLETQHSREFGSGAARVELTGADGGPVQSEGPGVEAVAALAERIHALQARRVEDDAAGFGEVVEGSVVEDGPVDGPVDEHGPIE